MDAAAVTPERFLSSLFPSDLSAGQLAVWTLADKRTIWKARGELDELLRAAEQAAPSSDVYFHAAAHDQMRALEEATRQRREDNPTAAPARPETTRGCTLSATGIGCFWIEVDCRGGVHKEPEENLPTRDEALAFLYSLPLRPSAVVWSGGGFHAYWILREFWCFASAEEHAEAGKVERAWVSFLQGRAAEKGWKLDSVGDLARILRVPGTFNRKNGHAVPVTIERFDEDLRFNVSDFLEWISLEAPATSPAEPTKDEDEVSEDDGRRILHALVNRAVEKLKTKALKKRHEALQYVAFQARHDRVPRAVVDEAAPSIKALLEPLGSSSSAWDLVRVRSVIRWAYTKMKPGEPSDEAKRILDENGGETPGDEKPRVSLLAQVLEEKKGETSWVVNSLLAVGAVGILSGDYYIGKSTVTSLLLAHVAAGRRFLGFEVAEPLPVLYWSAEGNRKMFAERVACACFNAGIDAATLDFGFPPADFVAPFDSPEFASFVIASGRKLIACDSVGYFMNEKADENSATDWKKYVMKPLYAISSKTGASFFLTHHYSKPAENRMGRHRIRGSSAIGSDCDTVMRIEAPNGDDAPQRKLFIDKVRNEEKPGTLSLTFEPKKALLVLDEAAADYVEPAPKESRGERKQAAKAETERKAKEDVDLLFQRSPAGLTSVEIERAFHRGRQWVASTIGELFTRGAIRRDMREQKNRRGQVRRVEVWMWVGGG